jgi:hypothetical protein
MPPNATPPLAACEVSTPVGDRRIELKSGRNKGKDRLVVYIFDGTHRESIVWLSGKCLQVHNKERKQTGVSSLSANTVRGNTHKGALCKRGSGRG